MLTALLLQISDHHFLAPASLLHFSKAADWILRAANVANLADRPDPGWLFDQTPPSGWPCAEFFTEPDNRLLTWIDSPAEFNLVCGRNNLQLLLPQIDRLLAVRLDAPETAGLTPEILAGISRQDSLPELADPGSLGFSRRGGAATVKSALTIWQRPSSLEMISQLAAAGDCDLHLHTNRSDGADSPEQLVDRVMANGLSAFAITDHDILAALAPARAWLEKQAVRTGREICFIPGVELSIDEQRELHLLGYFPRGGTSVIGQFLVKQRKLRRQRNTKMIEQLQALGYPISLADFESTGEGTIGRLQAAILLRDRGHFPSIDAAFDQLLGYGRPAYIDRPRPTAAEAIWLIRQAGGVAVLAHPALYGWCSGQALVADSLLDHLESLKKQGLQGVEAFHGEASRSCQLEISAAARALGLIRTAGSDDHGANKQHTHMYQKGVRWLTEPEILVAAAMISGPEKNGQPTWFLARRSSPGHGLGFWEFPGGKIEPGESPAAALARELDEELAVKAEIGRRKLVLTFAYPDRRVILIGMEAFLQAKTWHLSVHDDARFVTAEEALQLELLPADILFFDAMLRQDA